MVASLEKLLVGSALAATSRTQLETWLVGSKTGAARLRAGFPPTWRVGDKTGTGNNGATNDVAIAWPPDRAPVLAAVYLTGSSAPLEAREAALAEVGRVIATDPNGWPQSR
jgi:beta-lactamase class A